MKNKTRFLIGFSTVLFLLIKGQTSCAQDSVAYNHSLSIEPVKGFIYGHTSEVEHLIASQPTGIIISLDKHNYGAESWHSRYNFMDVGFSLYYLDYQNSTLGKTIAVMPYYNFRINKNIEKRGDFKFKMAFGLGYNTNPYDRVENNKNNFLGSSISFGTELQLNYNYQISQKVSLKTGLSVIHFSNASISRPNKGINLVMANLGVQYALTSHKISYNRKYTPFEEEGIKYNVGFSFGSSEATTIGAGSFPFLVIHAYAQKRIGYKSGLQFGADFFLTQSIQEDIKYDPVLEGAQPDFKRIGIFIGHEWYINRLSLAYQFGYYVYRPYDSFKAVYQRINLKYYLTNKLYAGFSLKTHLGAAEAAEFGLGIQL